ncbi:MAG: hypothetical protein F6K42_09350 [Leptolyngbya sp. SIO1D8]|nr:hypothetical protein [Leptolyngbya sp. SIO1D8]
MQSPSDNQEFSARSRLDNVSEGAQEIVAPEHVDLSQVYVLIDSILPFEACLYYQVLPLFIEGNRLVIGMVNLDDYTASGYVKKQLSYINYSISFKKIQSEWHRNLLSKYLSHNAKAKQQPQLKSANSPEPSKPENPPEPPKAKKKKRPTPPAEERNLQTTFIVDQPDEIPDALHALPLNEPVPQGREANRPSIEVPQNDPIKEEAPPAVVKKFSQPPQPPQVTASRTSDKASLLANTSPPLHLQIDDQYKNLDDTQLTKLSPKALMQSLLSKVLEEGIGRLYFEKRSDSGRILWSKDGILQAVVESVDSNVFQGVINEFKLLTHLSLIAAKKPRQVEIERLYKDQRVLLRFRVMPNADGEEATLQVLRGTALKFYQQQQIDKLGRDALDAAQILQRRLNDIRDRARQSLTLKPTRSETLPAIIQLLKQMEVQVQEIVSAYNPDEDIRNTQQDKVDS